MMENDISSEFSRWLARTFFNEQYGRTWSQKVEDEQGIPKNTFHTILIGAAFLGLLAYLEPRY